MQTEQIGKLLRVGGAAATVGVITCVHAAAEQMPLGQIMAGRAAVSGVLILIYGMIFMPRRDLLPNHWQPHLFRGALACAGMLLSYVAFATLPVAQAQTLLFLAPLIAVPLAAVRLRERLSPKVLIGLGLGFVGMLLILGTSFDLGPLAAWGAICGMAAAFVVALIQVTIRAMMATETAISTALSFTLIVALVSALSVFWGDWIWPQGSLLWVLVASGVFGALNLVLFAESLARASVTTLAPLDYTALIWALMADWLIFAVRPNGLSLMGSVLITIGALVVVLRSREKPVPA